MLEKELAIDSRVSLSDGNSMPLLGLGTWAAQPGGETRDAVAFALETGYRHIDTAKMYGNEQDVGEAVRQSSIPRQEIFVTTKLWDSDQGYQSANNAFDRSMDQLGLEYIDLYLIHWPVEKLRNDSWRALNEIKESGRTRSIGVSNFSHKHLQELYSYSDIRPVVNQIELSPFLQQPLIASFCRSENIQLTGYCPLAKGRRFDKPVLADIAEQHGKSPAQVMIRWALQNRQAVIPKSSNPKGIVQNADIFDFQIGVDEMVRLDGLDDDSRYCPDPLSMP
ncbi:MAG: 2,5-diketo-D-gluconic acid reductase [Gammaproteobacteria bacterium]|nr:MAG: 2,5-diketo-D-gluconic acid reductase [Gammaproteobacteria bacterium]